MLLPGTSVTHWTAAKQTTASIAFSSPPADDMLQRFNALVEEQLNKKKVTLAPDANKLMRDFIKTGVSKLGKEPAKKDIQRAEKSLLTFTDKLLATAEPGSEISAVTFEKTKQSICPMFPFC